MTSLYSANLNAEAVIISLVTYEVACSIQLLSTVFMGLKCFGKMFVFEEQRPWELITSFLTASVMT